MKKLPRQTIVAVLLGAGTLACVVGCGPAFTVDGDATAPLSPGVSTPLDVVITNPHYYPLFVSEITVAVKSVEGVDHSDRRCSMTDFRVEQLTEGLRFAVPPFSEVALSETDVPHSEWPQVGMASMRDPNLCTDASVEFVYTASGALLP